MQAHRSRQHAALAKADYGHGDPRKADAGIAGPTAQRRPDRKQSEPDRASGKRRGRPRKERMGQDEGADDRPQGGDPKMAVTKILAKNMRLDRLIAYVCNPAKTSEHVFVSCIGCERETAAKTLVKQKGYPL